MGIGVGHLCSVPSPALYAIAVVLTYVAAWLLAWDAFLETLDISKNPFGCSMRQYRPISGLREGIEFQITAQISYTCGCRLRRPCIGKKIGYSCW